MTCFFPLTSRRFLHLFFLTFPLHLTPLIMASFCPDSLLTTALPGPLLIYSLHILAIVPCLSSLTPLLLLQLLLTPVFPKVQYSVLSFSLFTPLPSVIFSPTPQQLSISMLMTLNFTSPSLLLTPIVTYLFFLQPLTTYMPGSLQTDSLSTRLKLNTSLLAPHNNDPKLPHLLSTFTGPLLPHPLLLATLVSLSTPTSRSKNTFLPPAKFLFFTSVNFVKSDTSLISTLLLPSQIPSLHHALTTATLFSLVFPTALSLAYSGFKIHLLVSYFRPSNATIISPPPFTNSIGYPSSSA